MRSHLYKTEKGEFNIPTDWKLLLGEDVINFKTPLVKYLKSLRIGVASFKKLCLQLDDFKNWLESSNQIRVAQIARHRTRSIELEGKIYTLPEDWKAVLGEDVLNGSKRLSIRLKELHFSRQHFMRRMKSYEPFFTWWKESNQIRQVTEKNASVEVRQKALDTIKERFPEGVMKDPEVLKKFKRTSLEHYGTPHPFLNKTFRENAIATLQERFGVEHPLQSEEIVNKRRETCLKRYGKLHPQSLTVEQKREIIEFWNLTPLEIPESTMVGTMFNVVCNVCGTQYTSRWVKGKFSVQPSVCPVCNRDTTRIESNLAGYIESLGFEVQRHYFPEWLERKEIDIFIPALKVGFEINGGLTHNSGFTPFKGSSPKPKGYHAFKTQKALDNGVLLYHIWNEWPLEVAKSIICAKLKYFCHRFYARKLTLEISKSTKEISRFFEKNHVLGRTSGALNFSLLTNDGQIIQSMQVKKLSETQLIIVRNASRTQTEVIGGFKKLLHAVINWAKSSGFKEIVTFAIRDLTPNGEASCYYRAGFTLVKDVGPTLSYWAYTSSILNDGYVIRAGLLKRNSLMKSKLLKHGLPFEVEESMTETEILSKLKVYPVYNSGCWKFTLTV